MCTDKVVLSHDMLETDESPDLRCLLTWPGLEPTTILWTQTQSVTAVVAHSAVCCSAVALIITGCMHYKFWELFKCISTLKKGRVCCYGTLVTLPDYTVSMFRHNSVGLTCLPEVLLEVWMPLQAGLHFLQYFEAVRARYVWFQQFPLVALVHLR